MTGQGVRIQKALADAAVASRRAAEALVEAGRVTVNGEPAHVGQRVRPGSDVIALDGRVVGERPRPAHVALHKPPGVTSTVADRHATRTVVDLVPEAIVRRSGRLYPVGRLDRESEGLILLTNDGAWAQRVAHPGHGVEREYAMGVATSLDATQIRMLTEGVALEEGVARARSIRLQSDAETRRLLRLVGVPPRAPRLHWYRVVLAQGWKRQVRRMLVAVGAPVVRLVRVRIGPLRLGDLAPGEARELTAAERDALVPPQGRRDRPHAPAAEAASDAAPAGPHAPAAKARPDAAPAPAGPHAPAAEARPDAAPAPAGPHAPAAEARPDAAPAPAGPRAPAAEARPDAVPAPAGPDVAGGPHAPRPGAGRQALRVAIDGPGSSGKSSIGAGAARELGYRFFDTGILYRGLAWLAADRSVPATDPDALVALIPHMRVADDGSGSLSRMLVDDRDVTEHLHDAAVDRIVSAVARVPQVREALLPLQRAIASESPDGAILAGRDIGTVVLPDADLKVWLEVSLEERARRRSRQRGHAAGSEAERQVMDELRRRDGIDSNREAAPLVMPEGAIRIRTDGLALPEAIDRVVRHIRAAEAAR